MKARTILGLTKGKSRQAGLFFFMLFASIFTMGAASTDKTENNGENIVEIEYGYPDQSIFLATINDRGQPDTPMTLLAEALMTRAKLPWHASPYPAKRLFDNLNKGATNFSILVRAASLQESCIFSRKPVYSTNLNVYYMGEKSPVKRKEELAGKHIITIRGYSYAGLLKFIKNLANKIENEVASTHKAAFEMLKNNRAHYLLDYASAAEDILSQSPISCIKSNPINRLDIFLVLSKSYPDAQKLMIKLEKIVETLDVNKILKRNEKGGLTGKPAS